MNQKIIDHYLEYGMFTYPGLYKEYMKSLPDDIETLGYLLRKSFIHRTTLAAGNKGTNKDLKYGDMNEVPWWRQPEDDNLPTTAAMMAEFFRRDSRGLTLERTVENKLVLTCRYVSILMASILKTKGIPARVRSGFASYFEYSHDAWDHWVTQYWNRSENRWITIDVDASFHNTGFNMYDIPDGKFEYAPDVWINIKNGKKDENHYRNAGGPRGLITCVWELFYDLNCLMNNEIIYMHGPEFSKDIKTFRKLPKETLEKVDNLARLMKTPDENFNEIENIWNTDKEFRLLKGSLL